MNPYQIEVVEALLDGDDFIVLSKTIATILGGADEALIVKKIYDWCKTNQKKKSAKHFHDGWYWTYNSYEEWKKEFPWMSTRTIQRKILKLESTGVIRSARHRASQNDQTKWYRVDMTNIYQLRSQHLQESRQNGAIEDDKMTHSTSCQNGAIDHAKMASSRSRQNGMMSSNKETIEKFPQSIPSRAANDYERWGRSTSNAATDTTKQTETEKPIAATKPPEKENALSEWDYPEVDKSSSSLQIKTVTARIRKNLAGEATVEHPVHASSLGNLFPGSPIWVQDQDGVFHPSRFERVFLDEETKSISVATILIYDDYVGGSNRVVVPVDRIALPWNNSRANVFTPSDEE